MCDCSTEILAFHDKHVRLSQSEQDNLRAHRDANRKRVKNGQEKNENPSPREFVIQGSYAMHTINQQPEKDYDIDDGVMFLKEDLVGPKGGEMSPLAVRQMVREAVHDDAFVIPPEVKTNCVRVFYKEGHHVDIPAYRECMDNNGDTYFELAGANWRCSDPKAVTAWFNEAVIEQSSDTTNGRQMRRIVRLIKFFSKSRSSWNMPSGFILSVLVEERFHAAQGKDDLSFYETIRGVHSRLDGALTVEHPVIDEMLTKSAEDACMVELRNRLSKAIADLSVLDDPGCTPKAALKAWKKVFNHSYFDEVLEEENSKAASFSIGSTAPSEAYDKRGGGMYG